MVIFDFFKKKLPPAEKKHNHTVSMQKLIELTRRMDEIDRKRKLYELFIDAVIDGIKPGLLARLPNGCYKFLENKEVIIALKIAIEKVLNNDIKD